MRNRHLASAYPSFGEELFSRSYHVDMIDLTVTLSVTKINRKYTPRPDYSLKASAKDSYTCSKQHCYENRDVFIA